MSSPDPLENSSVYKFIIERKYRRYRHLLLISILLVISTGLTVMPASSESFKNNIYLLLIVPFVLVVSGCYYNRYVLIPKTLLKGKYALYFGGCTCIVFLIVWVIYGLEYYIFRYRHASMPPYSVVAPDINLLLRFFSDFFIISICYLGIMVTVLIGHWHRIGKYSSQLENEYFQIQLQKLKSQVSPSFLSGTLQAAVKDIEFAPDNTSRILIQLSKVLRYQLYDSNREYVLLSSEITFLGNYLELEQVKRTGFTYTIQTEGRFLGVLIPPLIFTPFVEYIIYRIEGTLRNLSLSFIKKQGRLSFICEAGWEMAPYIPSKDMEEVRRRLEMLYKGHYFLDIKLIGKSIVICLELQLK